MSIGDSHYIWVCFRLFSQSMFFAGRHSTETLPPEVQSG